MLQVVLEISWNDETLIKVNGMIGLYAKKNMSVSYPMPYKKSKFQIE